MKNVVVFSNMYPSREHPTYGIFVKNQVELLRTSGVQVDVVAIEDPGKGKAAAIKKYAGWLMRSVTYLLKNRRRLALTHAHYVFPTGVLSLIGKKLLKLPFVVTVHGGDIDKMASKNALIEKMTQRILQEAEAVIVVGEKLKADVTHRFGVDSRRVHVMSMGVNTAVFHPASKEEARAALGLATDEPVILYVGNVIEAKGLLELVEAFSTLQEEFPNAVLYIIGSQKDHAFMEKIRNVIREKNVQRIKFQEPLGQANLATWMSAADVLTLPSHHEGFGLVALEGMATGVKVVGTNVGGLSYLLSDGGGILVEPKEPKSLAEGISAALRGTSGLTNESVIAERVKQHSYESILHKLLSIYEEVSKKRNNN